ncbi:MAG: type II toxin-antitoxin system VapC family toxin [Candidatus Freyarchaeota archaeon]|nr:type II toxin-antitoxin system VapC family toxin [Candidatus Jordarchaeia archaeon]MBS7270038.1 type II toxin-antitoxin system VapC family toxin [Candidatus Jordarchaeia archaeon]MBS7280496.1 type II toxin-antitoxin system VapC family toxin [Candidatus Jordarchaeia archaeon]
MKCIDTTYFVDLIRRPNILRELTTKLDDEGIHATTVLNVYEALFGAYALKDDEKREKIIHKLREALERLEVLSFRYDDAVLAAKIAGELARNGKRVGVDAVVAAIAINNGCKAIVTKNEKHFTWIMEITGLRVETY